MTEPERRELIESSLADGTMSQADLVNGWLDSANGADLWRAQFRVIEATTKLNGEKR